MKIVFDFLPIILFFATYKFTDIFMATKVAIIASVILFVWIYLQRKKPNIMQWFSVLVIIVFGGATLFFEDPSFIKWKPTILYLLMGSALVVTRYFFKKDLLKTMMGEQLTLPVKVWGTLNWMWVGFFVFMACANLYVAYSFSQDTWVNFKLFGGIGITIAFVILQSLYLAKHMEDNKKTNDKTE